MKEFFFISVLFLLFHSVFGQTLTAEERVLYESIMKHRKQKGLSKIPLSAALTKVAQLHVVDLVEHKPDTGKCNSHSWSNKGEWTACCYTKDHKAATCMWNKPNELTDYPGKGYEIAAGSNDCCSDFVMTPEYALNGWIESKSHHAVMVNEGIWKDVKWNAIGVGLFKGFAVVWFGEEKDASLMKD